MLFWQGDMDIFIVLEFGFGIYVVMFFFGKKEKEQTIGFWSCDRNSYRNTPVCVLTG
jgi:hypothetical protein